MNTNPLQHGTRRTFLGTIAALSAGALFTRRGLFAQALQDSPALTPRQTQGPFFPDKLPLDTDNDLIVINDSLTPASGQVTHLGGRVLDGRGDPVNNVVVEIWQCDVHGAYLHSGTSNRSRRDAHFQGFGRFLTGTSGEYYFRTIKPVAYPGRTPHIHVKVRRGRQTLLTTQCYNRHEPANARDGIYNAIRDPRQRENITLDFAPVPDSNAGELACRFEIVLGWTPQTP